jgi:hypothetical protein
MVTVFDGTPPSERTTGTALPFAADWHAGVVEAAGVLHGAGLLHAGANLRRRLGIGIAAQFLEGDGWNLDVDIDAVEQGTADLAQIVLNLARGAPALAGGIAVEPALTPVQITTATEYEPGVPGGSPGGRIGPPWQMRERPRRPGW